MGMYEMCDNPHSHSLIPLDKRSAYNIIMTTNRWAIMVYPLNELNPGDTAEVVWIISDPYMSSQLDALGFTFKEQVTCILGGRKDSMSAYLIRGTLIALRTENAREVLVRAPETKKSGMA